MIIAIYYKSIFTMLRLAIFGLLISTLFAVDPKIDLSLSFSTQSVRYVFEGKEFVVYYNATCRLANLWSVDDYIDFWTIEFTTVDTSLAEVSAGSPSPSLEQLCTSTSLINDTMGNAHSASVTIKGRFFGITMLKAKLRPNSGSTKLPIMLKEQVQVQVIRNPDRIAMILGYVILALTVLNNFWWGTQMEFKEAKKLLRRPSAILLALGLQFVFMPSWANAVGGMFHLVHGTQLAHLALAASHIGGPVHFLIGAVQGNLTLSLLINVFSVTLAFGSMSWWLLTVGKGLIPTVQVPYEMIGQNWGVFVCPLVGGMLFQYLVPKCKTPISKILIPTNLMLIALSLGTSIATQRYQFKFFNVTNVLSGALIPHITIAVSLLLAWGFNFDRAKILAITITTPFKDVGVVMPVIYRAIPPPFADLWLTPMLVSVFLTPLAILPYMMYLQCFKSCCDRCRKKNKEEEEEKDADKDEGGADGEELVDGKDVQMTVVEEGNGEVNHGNKSNELSLSNGEVTNGNVHHVEEGVENQSYEKTVF